MKLFFYCILLALIIGAGTYVYISREHSGAPSDYKNATYTIDGQPVTLENGVSQTPAAPGSASMVTTTYFGNEATGDLNGDGVPDVAFILTQNGDGSGTFYYVVVALKTANGYQGTNAILLGDRIAPQTTEIKNNQLVVNYADRNANDPMTVQPSIGVTKYITVTGTTLSELPPATLSPNVYPLYGAVTWGQARAAEYQNINGYRIDSEPIQNITNIAGVTAPFVDYYKQKLEALGWQVDNALAAAAPGSEIIGYDKGTERIIVSYTSIFKTGGVSEPEQCPCDVTLSVFSGS